MSAHAAEITVTKPCKVVMEFMLTEMVVTGDSYYSDTSSRLAVQPTFKSDNELVYVTGLARPSTWDVGRPAKPQKGSKTVYRFVSTVSAESCVVAMSRVHFMWTGDLASIKLLATKPTNPGMQYPVPVDIHDFCIWRNAQGSTRR